MRESWFKCSQDSYFMLEYTGKFFTTALQSWHNRKTVESEKEAVEQLSLSPTNLFFKPHVNQRLMVSMPCEWALAKLAG